MLFGDGKFCFSFDFVIVVLFIVNCLFSLYILKDFNDGYRVLLYSIEWFSELCYFMLMYGNK